MSRIAKYKTIYFCTVGVVGILSLWVILYVHLTLSGFLILITALLMPGRILGFFWRDLLRGLRLLNAKQFSESKKHSELFLEYLNKRPWIKKLIWLGSGTYSRDPEAMALNNLGAAEIMLGDFDNAGKHLRASIKVDNLNPLPFFNMGNLFTVLGNHQIAETWFNKAIVLGFSRNRIDKILTAAQGRFAETDSRGKY